MAGHSPAAPRADTPPVHTALARAADMGWAVTPVAPRADTPPVLHGDNNAKGHSSGSKSGGGMVVVMLARAAPR